MSDRRIIGKAILYFGKPLILACDARCFKAWGTNNRPRVQLDPSNDEDYALLADDELGPAPLDPGTYEGECAKPTAPHMHGEMMNKWCARECERSRMVANLDDLALPDFSQRVYNIERSSAGAGPTGETAEMSDDELMAGLRDLEEKFSRDTQVYLWHRNQARVDLIREVLRRISGDR